MRRDVTFRPIELPRDGSLCVTHRIDSFVVSYGNADRFDDGGDGTGYLRWLEKLLVDPGTCALACVGDEVVGQIESVHNHERAVGYVFLYYVTPSWRRKGVGTVLDDYVEGLYRARGCEHLRLAVSETNERALAFYRARGWVDQGPRDVQPSDRVMTKPLVK